MLMATSCLSSISCTGSSLWGWFGHSDPPVVLDWSSSKIKVLGVFVAIGDWDDDNWHPCIDAVHHVLKSWHSRPLSFCGQALVINALALSWVWYVASLIHIPAWVAKELSSLAFSFFWSGKCELVSCSVMIQSPLFGSFLLSVFFTRCGLFLASGWGGSPPPPLAGPHSCLFGFCLFWVFCHLLSFPGLFHRFIALSFWHSVAWTVCLPHLAILLSLVHPVPMSAALWLTCPLKAVICIFCLRTWFHHVALTSSFADE